MCFFGDEVWCELVVVWVGVVEVEVVVGDDVLVCGFVECCGKVVL